MKNYIKILLILISSFTFGQEIDLLELKKIEFSGNSYFSNLELKDVVAFRESPNSISQWLGEEALYFDSLLIGEELLRLKSFYFNHGFFQTVISAKFNIDSTKKSAELTFNIREGNSTYYNNISVHGVDSLESSEILYIRDYSKIDTAEIYSYRKITGINLNMINYLRNNGYMFASIDSTLIYIDTLKNRIDIDVFIDVGEKYSILDVIVEKSGVGKDEVDDELIKEITGIGNNEIYSQFKTQRGQSRLYKTNLFTTASVKSSILDTVNNKVPIKIETEIGSMYEVTPEVIMNNEDNRFNLGLGLGFSKRNFFGGARVLTLNGSIAAQNIFEFVSNMSVNDTSVIGYADLRLIMEQPFLFDKNIDTRYEIYSTLQKRLNEYNTTVLGFNVNLDFELPPFVYLTSFGTSWNLENLSVLYQESYLNNIFTTMLYAETDWDTLKVDTVATFLTNQISKSTQTNNTLLSFNFGANKTNDFGFPTKGYKLNLLLANANFLQFALSKMSNFELNAPLYYKVQIDFSLFPSLYYSKEDAFGIKLRVGNIHVYDGIETSVPYNQRFTSGGSNSLRGWQSRELVPEFTSGSFDLNSISPADFESIFLDKALPGGLFQFEGSIETRNRIIGNIGGAVFLDFGNTWSNAKAFRFDEIAISAGFGFRYYTDFIPFRIDFGIKLYDPDPNSQRISERSFWNDLLQIHFAIGEAF
ncbi:MAG: BamA/TamA family outer membrane protein [Melioribacteraceae bacterium]|nr:BamA/TamA family outer membrane protein [Melioribacteraceae bacterium]